MPCRFRLRQRDGEGALRGRRVRGVAALRQSGVALHRTAVEARPLFALRNHGQRGVATDAWALVWCFDAACAVLFAATANAACSRQEPRHEKLASHRPRPFTLTSIVTLTVAGAVKESPRKEIPLAVDYSSSKIKENNSSAIIIADWKLLEGPQVMTFHQGPQFPNASNVP